MKVNVECAGCGRSFTRGGFEVPEDLAERGIYVVVDTCSKCAPGEKGLR